MIIAEPIAEEPARPLLLELPDHCLLAVLQCCDKHALANAARAHSRLQQAASLVDVHLSAVVSTQEHVESAWQALANH